MEHCSLHIRAEYGDMCLKREVREGRTGSSSLNFFQADFTRVVVGSSQPRVLGSKRKLPPLAYQHIRSNLDFPLWSAIQGACNSLAPCISVIRTLCQALGPTVFLVYPVLAATAEDAFAIAHLKYIHKFGKPGQMGRIPVLKKVIINYHSFVARI